MKILVSACLLGENCKYNGGNNLNPAVLKFVDGQEVIPICPEMLAGLGCPRTPVEIVDGVVTARDGTVVDGPLREAVAKALVQSVNEHLDGEAVEDEEITGTFLITAKNVEKYGTDKWQ